MKKLVLIFLLFILIVAGVYTYIKLMPLKKRLTYPLVSPAIQNSTVTPTPSVILQPTMNPTISYCSPQDLQALISPDHAAGNVYDTFTIKNISGKTCPIPANNYITTQYNSITNIALAHIGTAPTNLFQLAPGQIVYSQAHYPNGPQCQNGTTTQKIQFTYVISPTQVVTFADQNGSKDQSITICTSPQEKTTIQIWNMSLNPITQ